MRVCGSEGCGSEGCGSEGVRQWNTKHIRVQQFLTFWSISRFLKNINVGIAVTSYLLAVFWRDNTDHVKNKTPQILHFFDSA